MHNKYFSFAPALALSIVVASSVTSVFAMEENEPKGNLVQRPQPNAPSKPSEAEDQKEFDAKKEEMKRANLNARKRLGLTHPRQGKIKK